MDEFIFNNSLNLQFSESQINNLETQFFDTIQKPDIGFYHLKNLTLDLEEIKKILPKLKSINTLVHIGLGGSVLGPQALTDSLLGAQVLEKKNIIYLDNLDPEDFYSCLQELSWPNTLFYIVSKSGETLETKAMLHGLLQTMEEKMGAEASLEYLKTHFLLCTDPQKGFLRTFARAHDIPCLTLPPELGGRFSVLSSVGFVPLAFIHQDFEQASQEIQTAIKELQNKKSELRELIKLALTLTQLYEKKSIKFKRRSTELF